MWKKKIQFYTPYLNKDFNNQRVVRTAFSLYALNMEPIFGDAMFDSGQ